MPYRTTLAALALTTSMALLAGCASVAPAPQPLAATAARTPQLSTFHQLLNQSGLADTLKTGGPYTVFAPSDAAFKAVPAKTLADLQADKAQLRAVLSYHIVPGRVLAADVKPGNVKSVQGANLALSRAGTFVTVEDAMVERADLLASDGVIHTIDRVLMPPKR